MTRTHNRTAFTLIELLVVMAIMILVLALGAAVAFSGAFNSQKVVSAADRSSGWLIVAKNRAKRDGAPRGVRFIRNPGNPTQVTEAQYIEAPEQWVPNIDQELNPHGPRIIFSYQFNPVTGLYVPPFRVYFVSFDPNQPAASPANIARQGDITEFTQKIGLNDLLILPEIGGPFRITNIAVPAAAELLQLSDVTLPGPPPVTVPAANSRVLTLAGMPNNPPPLGAGYSLPVNGGTILFPQGTLTTYKFGFQPSPKPLIGEPLLQLTGTTVIDFAAGGQPTTTSGVTMDPAGHFDILFSPSGQVLNNPSGVVCLWVRDPDKLAGNPRVNPVSGLQDDSFGYNNAGEQILVTIYTRTGFVATHPISTVAFGLPTYDPLLFAKDGVNSGF